MMLITLNHKKTFFFFFKLPSKWCGIMVGKLCCPITHTCIRCGVE